MFGVEYTDSNIKIEPKYESISHEYDGIFVVKEKNKYGIINLKGDYIVKPIYIDISNKKNGYFLIEDEEYKYGVIDLVGNVVVNPKYKEISVTKYGFIVCEGVKKNGFIGFNGKIIIPLKYSNVFLEKFGLISLSKYKNNSFLYGLKDLFYGSYELISNEGIKELKYTKKPLIISIDLSKLNLKRYKIEKKDEGKMIDVDGILKNELKKNNLTRQSRISTKRYKKCSDA